MRPDLAVQRQTFQGRNYWVIKDPVALKYYRFEEEEYALLEMLDGEISLDEIQSRFDERFAPQRITLQELHQFVGMLYRSSLVVSDARGQGQQLRQRRQQNARRQLWSSLGNVLAFRFKGFDPDRLLAWLDSLIGWLFSKPAIVACLTLAVLALLLVTVEFDVFVAKLPAFHEFFAAKNWIWLALTLAVTKVLHELGHGLACKHVGGECHEMGVMLLVLTPCLYCNVSDSWMLPSKWRRAAIGAAGMYVEIMLASLCTFLWWFSQPGLLNYLCLNVMFVCSVSTIIFNANPLLRYDGYYILSDLIEIPNLRQKATAILQRKLSAWLLGLRESRDPFLPQRRQMLFALYSLAAAAYRWVVALSILWFLYRVFEPYGLQIIGQTIALASLYGLAIHPLWRLGKFFYQPGRIRAVKKPRMLASAAAIVAVLLGILLIPLPHHVTCSLHVQPRGADAVYVDVAGIVEQIHARPGQSVKKDQPLLTLSNIDVELAIEGIRGERAQLVSRLESLRQRAFEDENAGLEIAQVEESLAALDQLIEKRRRDLSRLTIVAPAAGVVVPPPLVRPAGYDSGRLPTWSGTPLEAKNHGAFLSDGVLVCQVGDPRRLEAVLAIDQTDIEFVREGQTVEVFLEQLPGRTFTSTIRQISQVDMKTTPRNLSSKGGGDLATTADATGRERPLSTTYQANAPLDDPAGQLVLASTGRAKIRIGYQTVATRVWRYVCHTFNFQM